MSKESFPGLCHNFVFRESFRGESASLTTSDPAERADLSAILDDQFSLPLGLLGKGYSHTSGEGKTTLESRDVPGVRQIARRLQRKDYIVEDLDR